MVSTDTDFGTILALREEREPSVILFRRASQRRYQKARWGSFSRTFPDVERALAEGSVVVFEESRIRIRPLPIRKAARRRRS